MALKLWWVFKITRRKNLEFRVNQSHSEPGKKCSSVIGFFFEYFRVIGF